MTAVELQPPFPCPDADCPHLGECIAATRRRAEGGHTCRIVPAPKMDAPRLVAADCSCGRYRSSATLERLARQSWRAHADAKMGFQPVLVRTARPPQ